MTTVRVRKLREVTRESVGDDLPDMTDPVEVMVCGQVRGIVHFPKEESIQNGGVVVAWLQEGWEKPHIQDAIKEAALHAVVLSDRTESLW